MGRTAGHAHAFSGPGGVCGGSWGGRWWLRAGCASGRRQQMDRPLREQRSTIGCGWGVADGGCCDAALAPRCTGPHLRHPYAWRHLHASPPPTHTLKHTHTHTHTHQRTNAGYLALPSCTSRLPRPPSHLKDTRMHYPPPPTHPRTHTPTHPRTHAPTQVTSLFLHLAPALVSWSQRWGGAGDESLSTSHHACTRRSPLPALHASYALLPPGPVGAGAACCGDGGSAFGVGFDDGPCGGGWPRQWGGAAPGGDDGRMRGPLAQGACPVGGRQDTVSAWV